MTKKKPFDEETFINLYNQQQTFKEISTEMNLSTSHLSKKASELIHCGKIEKREPKRLEFDEEKLIQLYEEGI